MIRRGWGTSPVALRSCHSTTSTTGDSSLMMLHRWLSQTLVTFDGAAAPAIVGAGLFTILEKNLGYPAGIG